MLRGEDPGTCCSDTSLRVSSYFYFRATRILLQFCPRDMSHEVQLVELCGTCCRDKTLQGCDVPSSALLCNAFMLQNQHFSQSQATTKIIQHRFNFNSTSFKTVSGGSQTVSTLLFNKIQWMLKPFARGLTCHAESTHT